MFPEVQVNDVILVSSLFAESGKTKRWRKDKELLHYCTILKFKQSLI